MGWDRKQRDYDYAHELRGKELKFWIEVSIKLVNSMGCTRLILFVSNKTSKPKTD